MTIKKLESRNKVEANSKIKISDLLIFLANCGNNENLLKGKKYEDLVKEFNEDKFVDNKVEQFGKTEKNINEKMSEDLLVKDKTLADEIKVLDKVLEMQSNQEDVEEDIKESNDVFDVQNYQIESFYDYEERKIYRRDIGKEKSLSDQENELKKPC